MNFEIFSTLINNFAEEETIPVDIVGIFRELLYKFEYKISPLQIAFSESCLSLDYDVNNSYHGYKHTLYYYCMYMSNTKYLKSCAYNLKFKHPYLYIPDIFPKNTRSKCCTRYSLHNMRRDGNECHFEDYPELLRWRVRTRRERFYSNSFHNEDEDFHNSHNTNNFDVYSWEIGIECLINP